MRRVATIAVVLYTLFVMLRVTANHPQVMPLSAEWVRQVSTQVIIDLRSLLVSLAEAYKGWEQSAETQGTGALDLFGRFSGASGIA